MMVLLWSSIVWHVCFNIITAQYGNLVGDDATNCQNHMLNISSKCSENENYYSPTIAIQTISGYNTNNVRSYSQISLLINANHDVIITPHCISMDITVNPTIINYLSHQWLINKVEWPSNHKQGEIITFSTTQKESKYIIFNEPCIISPNATNALILLFNTNFNAYNIEIHNTQNCGKKNSITIYDKLYNYNTNINDQNSDNCFPMQSDARFNLYIPNGTNDSIEQSENVSTIKKTKNDSSGNGLVIALIVIIVFINIASCILLWYFNQKQLNKNIRKITRNLQDITHFNNDTNTKINDNTTTVISSLPETKRFTSINNNKNITNNNGKKNNDLPTLPSQNMTNNTNNTNNTIIWVNKSYFDSNHMDDFNLFNNKHNRNVTDDSFIIMDETENENDNNDSDDNIEDGIIQDELMSNQSRLNKLRILLPINNNTHNTVKKRGINGINGIHGIHGVHGLRGSPSNNICNNCDTNTTLTAITLSDDDWKTPSTINTLNNTPNGINNLNNLYIMDEINENEETPIVKPSLQIGFRSNESTISVTSSIRLPAYHPNKIKIMNDNKHIPYNKQFIIAVTPPTINNNIKPSFYKIGCNSNNSNCSNKSLALPSTHTNHTNHTNHTQTTIHK